MGPSMKNFDKWKKNMISVYQYNDSGICPACNSEDTDFGFQIVREDERLGYGGVWCNSCKHAILFGRTHVPENTKIRPIPEDLVYNAEH